MKKLVKSIAYLSIAAITLFSSCKKQETEDEITMTTENLESDNSANKEVDSDDEASRFEEMYVGLNCTVNYQNVFGTCALVTVSDSVFPKTVTVDYGSGCTNLNGITKKGKVIIVITNDIRTVGATRTITFDNFYVNDVKLEGSRVAQNIGLNAANHLQIQVIGQITAISSKGTKSRTFNRTREWLAGETTCTNLDDSFSITGFGTKTNFKGVTSNWLITSPLLINFANCKYITSGIIDIGTATKGAILDFGAGACDNIATLTTKTKNKVYTINLDNRGWKRK